MVIPIKQERRTWPSGCPSTMSRTNESAESTSESLTVVTSMFSLDPALNTPALFASALVLHGHYRPKGRRPLICSRQLSARTWYRRLRSLGERLLTRRSPRSKAAEEPSHIRAAAMLAVADQLQKRRYDLALHEVG